MAKLEEITDDNFKEKVSSNLIMVDFWAPWCAPCRMIAPILEEIHDEMQGKASIVKLNVDENPQVSQEYGITSIPTLLIFKNGEMVDRNVGGAAKEHYKSLLTKHLN